MSLMTIGTPSSVVISTITLKSISSLSFSRFFNFGGGEGRENCLNHLCECFFCYLLNVSKTKSTNETQTAVVFN